MTSFPEKESRSLDLVVVSLVVSAFGPYVFPKFGVYLEHVVIYVLFVLMMFRYGFTGRHNKLNGDLVAIGALWCFVLVWTLLPTFLGDYPRASAERVVAGMEHFVRPPALIFLLALMTRSLERAALIHSLRLACFVICLLLAINSILCVAQVYSDTWPLVQYFVRPDLGREQSAWLWQISVQHGRYCGIFSQAAENGVAHSIGLLAWIYYASSTRKVSLSLWVLLGMVIVGGVMSVSKSFLFGGLGAGIVYVLFSPSARRIVRWKAMVIATGCMVTIKEISGQWTGFDRLLTYFGEDESGMGALQLYSGNRITEEGSIADQFYALWYEGPFTGFGFGYDFGFPFDDAWLEFFAQGGAVAACVYSLILFMLGRVALFGLRARKEEGFLMISLLIFTVACGMGVPTLTLNRGSTLSWVLFSLCTVIIRPRRCP